MLLLLVAACGVTVRPTCVDTRTDLADDEVTDLGFSATDLLDPVLGDQTSPGAWEDGDAVDVTVGVARGEGSAVFVHQEADSVEEPNGNLFGRDVLLVGVQCRDFVEVPVGFSVRTADGEADFAAAARAIGERVDAMRVAVQLDADAATGIPPVAATPDTAFADANYLDGALTGGRLGWEGSDERSAWARYVLTWGDRRE